MGALNISQVGPIGGPGGAFFDDAILGRAGIIEFPIKTIVVHCGSYIDAIVVTYFNDFQAWHGGYGGNVQNPLNLGPGEFITTIWGTSGDYLNQISFTTNLNNSTGLLGGNPGPNFFDISFPDDDYYICGFWGRNGSYVDALGAYLLPIPD